MAYDRGEFALAADMYKRLARKGDARAQNDLGFLYSVGQGVPQDFGVAAKWFHKSAAQGHSGALFHLAQLYADGRGVEKNAVKAHQFYSLAGLLAEKPYRRHSAWSQRDAAAKRLSAADLQRARRDACSWFRTYRKETGKSGRTLPHCGDK